MDDDDDLDELPNYPREACPVCGFRPCSYECRLGLQQWDLERLTKLLDGCECDGLVEPDDADNPWDEPDDEDEDDEDEDD